MVEREIEEVRQLQKQREDAPSDSHLAKRKLEAEHERNHPEVQIGLDLDDLCADAVDGVCRASGKKFRVKKDSVYKNKNVETIIMRDT